MWVDEIFDKLVEINKIADTYSNPLNNDAGGSKDCYELKEITDKWIRHFNTFYPSLYPYEYECKKCGKKFRYRAKDEDVDWHTHESWVNCKYCGYINKIR